jgi:hypothetical protein
MNEASSAVIHIQKITHGFSLTIKMALVSGCSEFHFYIGW